MIPEEEMTDDEFPGHPANGAAEHRRKGREAPAIWLSTHLFHHKSGPLCFLLSHLFGFHRFCELLPKGQMRQGYVIQDEPKGRCSLCEVIAHLSGDQLSLGDQFSSIKASHHGLEDLCSDGRQHALVVVPSDAGEDSRKLTSNPPEEDAQRDVDILFKSLLPVITGTLRGRERQAKIIGFCTQGMRK